MLAFNRLDNLLTVVVSLVLQENGRADLIGACTGRDFWLKILTLDLLKSSVGQRSIKNVPLALMREVAAHRNKVAHGHFDQNPFSGEYDIVVKNVSNNYSASDLDKLTAKTNQAWDALRYSEAFYHFTDVSAPPQ